LTLWQITYNHQFLSRGNTKASNNLHSARCHSANKQMRQTQSPHSKRVQQRWSLDQHVVSLCSSSPLLHSSTFRLQLSRKESHSKTSSPPKPTTQTTYPPPATPLSPSPTPTETALSKPMNMSPLSLPSPTAIITSPPLMPFPSSSRSISSTSPVSAITMEEETDAAQEKMGVCSSAGLGLGKCPRRRNRFIWRRFAGIRRGVSIMRSSRRRWGVQLVRR